MSEDKEAKKLAKKRKFQDDLVGRLANVAGSADKVECYLVLYATKDGCVTFHEDGSDLTKLGMVDIWKENRLSKWVQVQR